MLISDLDTPNLESSFYTQVADYRNFHRGQLNNAINDLIQISLKNNSPQKYLYISAQVTFINAASLEALLEQKGRIILLFYEALRPCDYDRSVIKHSFLEKILEGLPFRAFNVPDSLDQVTSRRICNTTLEVLFASRLGVEPEKADSEFHEVYYLLGRSKNRLGVFKPKIKKSADEECYGSSDDREAHIAEVANYQLDRFLDTGLVPYTTMLSCNLMLQGKPHDMQGSFQFYVTGADFLLNKLQTLTKSDLFNPNHIQLRQELNIVTIQKLVLKNFEKLAFFDLLTGNNDRHFRNLFLLGEQLVAIDNANSLPWCHNKSRPPNRMRPLHYFKWSTLPHAQKPFSEACIDWIKNLNLAEITNLLSQILISNDTPSSEENYAGKISTFTDRFNTIKQLAIGNVTMAQIADAVLSLENPK